mgnify:FL=1
MQNCSNAYKQQIKKHYRNLAHMAVSIGVINQEAQEDATVNKREEYTYFSDLEKLLSNFEVKNPYATLEESFTKVDGSFFFLPRNESRHNLANQGVVSDGVIRFDFTKPFDIKGLTIEFAHVHPLNFTVTTNNKSVTFENAGTFFKTDEIFNGTTFIEIKANKMLYEHTRFRIYRMIMGFGVYFDNRKIIGSTKKEHISPIMEDLQTLDFSMDVENRDRAYDVENEKSTINFLEVGQDVSIRYGYELDDGTVEWFQGGKLKLSRWSSNDIKLSISAKDRFDSLDGTYQKGIYKEEGASLYDLATDVFLDGGVDVRDFEIDPYLRSILIQNPIPAVKHKEALQLIANAGRCILYQNRYGKIILRSDFMPEMSAMSEDKTRFSNLEKLLHSDEKSHYANLTQGYTRTDGKAYFLPKGSDYLNTGYVSESVSNVDGSFANIPKITIQMEHGFTVYGLRMLFHEYAPEKMSLAFYYQGDLLDTMEIDNAALDFKTLQQLPYMDKLVVSFIKQSPNTRVVLDSIIFGDLTDYRFTYGDELKEYPVGTIREKTQRISVVTRKYNKSNEAEKELVHEKVNQTEQEKEYEFYMNSPSYGYRASATGHNVEIIKSSCYMVRVNVRGAGLVDLSITGYEYLISNGSIAIEVNPSGRTLNWENPLISTDEHAIKVGEWMKPFLASNRDYSLTDRGEVRLDGADLAYLDSKHEKDMLIKLTDYTMNFNGAFSGSAKGRRV